MKIFSTILHLQIVATKVESRSVVPVIILSYA